MPARTQQKNKRKKKIWRSLKFIKVFLNPYHGKGRKGLEWGEESEPIFHMIYEYIIKSFFLINGSVEVFFKVTFFNGKPFYPPHTLNVTTFKIFFRPP